MARLLGTMGGIAALLWVAMSATASAQGPLADPRVAPVEARLRAAIDAADREGLPSDWLVDKIAEGLSKRAPAARIAAAVEQLLARMRIAESIRSSVRERAEPEERRAALHAIVDALSVGAERGELVALVALVASTPSDGVDAHERVRLAMRTVAELGERGFGGRASAQATLVAYRRGGVQAWDRLLDEARLLPRSDDALETAAELASIRARGGQRSHVDQGGPSRDDSRGQGRRRRTRPHRD